MPTSTGQTEAGAGGGVGPRPAQPHQLHKLQRCIGTYQKGIHINLVLLSVIFSLLNIHT